MSNWVVVSLVFLYWISRGVLEGYVWADKRRRESNRLICGRKGQGLGLVDYHGWRMIESLTVLGSILGNNRNVFLIIGAWFLGVFVYERFLSLVVFGRCFVKKPMYEIMGIKIKLGWAADIIYFLVGVLGLVGGF